MSFRYGQFCPVAKATEVLGERWTILIIRELLLGSTRYSDLQRGLSQLSPTLLTKRLGQLVDCGLLVRQAGAGGARPEYHLTPAGRELEPVIMSLGQWGMKWVRGEMREDELDVQLLMQDYCRRIDATRLPGKRTVIGFNFSRLPRFSHWWIVVEPGREREACVIHPGGEVDVEIRSDVRTMAEIWMGDTEIPAAKREGRLHCSGHPVLVRTLPAWLRISRIADIRPHPDGVRA